MHVFAEVAKEHYARQHLYLEMSAFGGRRRRMLYLIAAGYPEKAGEAAKALATEAYDEHLARYQCDITGHHYFDELREDF